MRRFFGAAALAVTRTGPNHRKADRRHQAPRQLRGWLSLPPAVIDLHSHILPGLDDGAATLEDALGIAEAAVADGIRVIAATPHVRAADYPTSPEQMERLVDSLRRELREAAVPLELLPGGEIAFDMLPELGDDELRRFGLAGNPRYLLLEAPYHGWPLELEDTFFQLQLRGFTPVLAHPERNAEVQASPERLAPLVERGTLVQLTAASLDGRLGPGTQKTGLRLLELGLAHLLASDAHAPTLRQIGMAAAVREIGDDELARWLTEDVPAAIVAGEEIPPRPARPRRFLRPSFRRQGTAPPSG
jgi:protein-tyrosine phosphatase